ncbi:MAG: LysM peptidoglycan-binding domain-containing protein [Anaerolineales bacterium]|nr:LysM peptidoglycan-binding domain-containing protein [Anaerolineales bacterium]
MRDSGKLTAGVIAAFSLLLVFGALFTALAETGFTAFGPTKTNLPDTPTSTSILLPTKEEQPPSIQPTEKIETPSPLEDTQEATSTDTPEITQTVIPTVTPDDSICTKPTGWVDYKIQSGDTLFSISLLFQTDVDTLIYSNCLTSNQIITGQILWVPNNPTLTPTKTPKPAATQTPKPADECYTLTLSHLGEGADAVANIPNSDGCPTGKYKAGEIITLTASPAAGWEVGSWVGTINDSSTAATNKVEMPAKDHLAKPVYVGICYPLSLSSGDNGGNPIPDKSKSTGCNTGEYITGETITFTADPDPGYTVDAWTGTDGGTNKLTMPASAASVSVTYKLIPPVCFALTLNHTGTGADPTASPTKSTGCADGEFTAGEAITLTASGGTVVSWTGTDDDNSTSTTNTWTMLPSPHTITVNYTTP